MQPSSDRQDPALVREAADACLAARAGTFAWALRAIAIKRHGASAADWAFLVKALLDPGPDGGVEDASGLAEACLDHALAESPGDSDLRRLRAEVASRKQSLSLPRRGVAPGARDVTDLLLDALDDMPAGSAEAFLDLLPEMQDAVVTELVDEAEPRTAPLAAAIVQSNATPALCCCLLEHAATWSAHPAFRDAVEEVAGSARRELLEPDVSNALDAVDRARGERLLLRPSEGRNPTSRYVPPAPGPVYRGTAQRAGRVLGVSFLFALSIVALIALVVLAIDPPSSPGARQLAWIVPGAAFLACAGLAVMLSMSSRVPFRIVATAEGARFELQDGPVSRHLSFPLDYTAAYHEVILRGRHGEEIGRQIHLTLTLHDSKGGVAMAFVENTGTMTNPPRGWALTELDRKSAPVLYSPPLFGHLDLDRLERQLARWNRRTRRGEAPS